MNHLLSARRVLARLRRTNQRRTSVRLARTALLCGAALGSLQFTPASTPPGTPPGGSAPALLVGDDTKTGGGPG